MVSIAVMAIGSLQPINPALRSFREGCENQPQPCWYGIVPGVTTLEAATDNLEDYGLSDDLTSKEETLLDGTIIAAIAGRIKSNDCQFMLEFYPDSEIPIIDNVMLTECTGINMGQLINAFGLPQRVQLPYRSPFFGYRMIFQSAIIDFTSSLNAFSSVRRIIIPLYFYPNESTDSYFSWHGFAPTWHYCQLEPNMRTC